MKQGSIGLMLNQYAMNHASYEKIAFDELKNGGRIRFKLTPHSYGNIITHWHITHLKSGELFIVLA